MPVPKSESVYTSEPAPTNKQGKVSLVLKACADEQTGEVCIARCKSFLTAGASVQGAFLHRNYNKQCFSKDNSTLPKYHTLHSSSSVKSINLTNIPSPRQLLQKNYLIRFPTSKSLTTLLCKRAAVGIQLFHSRPE